MIFTDCTATHNTMRLGTCKASLAVHIPGGFARHHRRPLVGAVRLGDLLLELGDGQTGVKVLGASVRAVEDSVAPIESHGVVEPSHSLARELISAVDDPAVSLHENGGSEVVLGVPPVGGAGGHAAGAEDALVHAVEFGSIFLGLEVLSLAGLLGGLSLEPRLDGFVVTVEVAEVGHKVLDHIAVWQGLDVNRLVRWLDVLQAGQPVLAVYVHGAGTADPLSAGSSEGEGRVHLVLDLNQGIEDHGTALVQIDRELLEERLLLGLGVVTEDAKRLQSSRACAQPSSRSVQHFP